MSFADTEHVPLAAVTRRLVVKPINVDAEIEQLFALALDQSFVRALDDRGVLIGIARRRSIFTFLHDKLAGLLRIG